MSHHALQQAVVRLLFDEVFVSDLHRNPDQALAGLDLTEIERAQLLAVDRRAWGHDALRRKRTLRTLVEEFKVSTTIALAETRSLASLERFFSTPFFHRAVSERGSMAMAFSEFLLDGGKRGEWKAPQIPDVVRLETAIAACRRTLAREGAYEPRNLPSTISNRARVRLAPGYGAGSFEANVIATIQQVEKYLFEVSLMPAMALCEDAPRLPALPEVDGRNKLYLLFHPGASGIALTNIDRPTFIVCNAARKTIEIQQLLSRAEMAGVPARQAQGILAEWLEEGALALIE